MNKMTRAALYIRVSTEEQALHGYSLEAQQEALERYAKEHELFVAGRYADEGASARKPYNKRPGFMRMLDDVEADRIDLILFIKLDRWFRSVRDYYKIQDTLEAHHVDWKAIMENYDTTTAAGRLHINIMLSVAQDEADRTSERIKFVFQDRLRRGEFAAGAIPIGYKLVDKHLVIDEETAPAVRAAFEYYDTCHNLRATMRMLYNEYGLTYYGSGVKKILQRATYKGEYHGIPNFCEPIVSAELFERVKNAAAQNNIKSCHTGHIYIYSRLIVCNECGHKMSGSFASGDYYYRCSKMTRANPCVRKKLAKEAKLEAFLLENLTAEIKKQIVERKSAAAKLPRCGPDKAQIKSKLARLKDLYLEGLIDMDMYRKDYNDLSARLQEAENVTEEPANTVIHLEGLLRSDPLNRYETRTREERQQLWHSIVREIRLDSNNNVVGIEFR